MRLPNTWSRFKLNFRTKLNSRCVELKSRKKFNDWERKFLLIFFFATKFPICECSVIDSNLWKNSSAHRSRWLETHCQLTDTRQRCFKRANKYFQLRRTYIYISSSFQVTNHFGNWEKKVLMEADFSGTNSSFGNFECFQWNLWWLVTLKNGNSRFSMSWEHEWTRFFQLRFYCLDRKKFTFDFLA